MSGRHFVNTINLSRANHDIKADSRHIIILDIRVFLPS